MNISEQVTNFLTTHKNQAYCDSCLQEQIGLARPQQAQRVAEALATIPLFKRTKGLCSNCGETRLVISTTWPK